MDSRASNMVEFYRIGDNLSDFSCFENVDFRTLCVINLHFNNLKDLKGLPHFPFVSELILSANQFDHINFEELTSSLPSLTSLDLSANLIANVTDFPFLPKLKTLVLARNDLVSADGLEAGCINVEVLDVSGNPQLDMDETMDTITCLTNLRNLVLFDEAEVERRAEECVMGRRVDNNKHDQAWLDCVDTSNYLFSVCLLLKTINGQDRAFWECQGGLGNTASIDGREMGTTEEPAARTEVGVEVEAEVSLISTGSGAIPLQFEVEPRTNSTISTPKLDKLMSMRANRRGGAGAETGAELGVSSDVDSNNLAPAPPAAAVAEADCESVGVNTSWFGTHEEEYGSPMPRSPFGGPHLNAPAPVAPSPFPVRDSGVTKQLQQQAAEYSHTQRKINNLISNLKESVVSPSESPKDKSRAGLTPSAKAKASAKASATKKSPVPSPETGISRSPRTPMSAPIPSPRAQSAESPSVGLGALCAAMRRQHARVLSAALHRWQRQGAAARLHCSYASFALYKQLASLETIAERVRRRCAEGAVGQREVRRAFMLWRVCSAAGAARAECGAVWAQKEAAEARALGALEGQRLAEQVVGAERDRVVVLEQAALRVEGAREEERAVARRREAELETALAHIQSEVAVLTSAAAQSEAERSKRKQEEEERERALVAERDNTLVALQRKHAEEMERHAATHRETVSALTAGFTSSSEKLSGRLQTLEREKEELLQQVHTQTAVAGGKEAIEAIVLEMRERNSALGAELGSIKRSQEGEVESLRAECATQVSDLEDQLAAKQKLLEETRSQYDDIFTAQLQKHGDEIQKLKNDPRRQEAVEAAENLRSQLSGLKDKHKSARIREQKYLRHIKDLCELVASLQGALRAGEVRHRDDVDELARQVSQLTSDKQQLLLLNPTSTSSRDHSTSGVAAATDETGGLGLGLDRNSNVYVDAQLSLRIKDKMLDDQAATIASLKRDIEELHTQITYYDDELIPQYIAAAEESDGLDVAERSQYEEEITQLKEVITVLQAQCARNKDIEGIYNTLIAKYSSEL